MVESEYGVDIRKKLFYQLAERSWPMIGMEALGMSLEDIFITVVDKSEESKLNAGVQGRIKRRVRGQEKNSLEREVGASLYEEAQRQRSESSLDASTDDEDDE